MLILSLTNQPQLFQLPGMVRTAGNQIDAGRLDRAVTKKGSQLHHITENLVKRPGKEVPKIMGKNLGGRNPRLSAQRLHFRPYLFPGQPAPASGEKDLARGNFIFTGVLPQLPAQLLGQ